MTPRTRLDRAAERIVDILDSTLAGLSEAELTRRMDAFSAGGNYIVKIINDPLQSRDHRERNDSQ